MNKDDLKMIGNELYRKIIELNQVIENNLKQINSFAFLVEYLAKEKEFLFGSTGYTKKNKLIAKLKCPEKIKEEELEDLLDLHLMVLLKNISMEKEK